MRIGARARRWSMVGGVCLAVSCAHVDVRKVPTPTQYMHWTDKMQHESDEMQGFRFYLPRPFLNVFESFPVRTDIYIADGVVSPDGRYVIIESVRSDSGLSKYIAGVSRGTRISNRDLQVVARGPDVGQGQSGPLDANAVAGQTVDTGVVDTGKKPPATETSSAPPAATGINTKTVGNDNGAFAYQPMRGNFDVAYLPDFEEQYVVDSHAGLGNAQFSLNLGQGWSLQSFNSMTDNSEINKRIFDVIDTSIAALKSAGGAALGIPLSPTGAAGTSTTPRAQSGPLSDDTNKAGVPGTPVSLKIVIVHYAAKGLYPVIKPRELAERRGPKQDTYTLFFDLFNLFPQTTFASEFDDGALARAQAAVDGETGKFTVPRYPYQYVSFNTFRYMAIEVLDPAGRPFGTLYDKTGTTGDPGDRQTVDMTKAITTGIDQNTGTPTTTIARIAQLLKGVGLDSFQGLSLAVDGEPTTADQKLAVKIKVAGENSSAADITRDQLTAQCKTKMTALLKPKGFKLPDDTTVEFNTGTSTTVDALLKGKVAPATPPAFGGLAAKLKDAEIGTLQGVKVSTAGLPTDDGKALTIVLKLDGQNDQATAITVEALKKFVVAQVGLVAAAGPFPVPTVDQVVVAPLPGDAAAKLAAKAKFGGLAAKLKDLEIGTLQGVKITSLGMPVDDGKALTMGLKLDGQNSQAVAITPDALKAFVVAEVGKLATNGGFPVPTTDQIVLAPLSSDAAAKLAAKAN